MDSINFLGVVKMSDIISNGATPYMYVGSHHGHHNHDAAKITEAIGNAAQHILNAEHVTQKSVGDAAHHVLNSEQITQKAIADTSTLAQKAIADSVQTTLLDNAHLKNQLNLDGNSTRAEIKFEGRNLDNRVCEVERHVADFRQEVAKEFCDTNSLVHENKFELTKQNAELKLLISEKTAHLEVKTLEQGEKTRTLIYEQELAELRSKVACCCKRDII